MNKNIIVYFILTIVMLIVSCVFQNVHDCEGFSNKRSLPDHTSKSMVTITLKSFNNKLRDLYKDHRSGNCMTHNDYDDDINNLKKKMTESFDDTTKISEDMLGIRQRFTKVLTSMLITSNGKNDIYIMGMTPFHRNLRILRVYLTDFFSKKNTTITLDNIKDFLRFYFTNFDPNEKFLIDLDSEYDQDGEIKDPVKEENIIRQSFRNAIFNNFNFGLKHGRCRKPSSQFHWSIKHQIHHCHFSY